MKNACKCESLLDAIRRIQEVCVREGSSIVAEREKQWAHDLCEISELCDAALAGDTEKKCECANPRSATGTLCWDCGRPLRDALAVDGKPLVTAPIFDRHGKIEGHYRHGIDCKCDKCKVAGDGREP